MTTSARLRRDPQKGKKEFSTYKGFTVIELMIAIAVLAIITSLALPSYRAILEKRQVTSGAQQLAAFLSSAQLEAVKRNKNVAVSYWYEDQENWCVGMVVDSESCTCALDPDTLAVDPDGTTCMVDGAVKAFTPANLKISPDNFSTKGSLSGIPRNDSFVIEPVRGTMVDLGDGIRFEFTSVPEGTYALNAQINAIGRVSICSASGDGGRAEKQVPGFDEC